jgi:hypothetical protein
MCGMSKKQNIYSLAIEARTFTIDEPSFFFSIYSPPRQESAAKLARDRLLEDMRFTSKMVCPEVRLFFLLEED